MLAAAVAMCFVLQRAHSYEDMSMSTCLLMDPYDSALPSESPFPYDLISSKSGVIHNQDSVIFTIKARDSRVPFQDFIVQARDNDSGVAVGTFVDTGDADIRIVNCFNRDQNTAIEFDSDDKTQARMRWVPDDNYEGFATLFATVTQVRTPGKEIFWLRVPSETLQVYSPWDTKAKES